VTGDTAFFLNHGGEILLETARLWVSRSIYNEKLDLYEIRDVIAPDEYHLYIDNSFYTNVFARWNIQKALELLSDWQSNHPQALRKVSQAIGLSPQEIDLWTLVSSKLHIPMDGETGLAEQFEGYFQREDWTIAEYDGNAMPVWPRGLDIHRLSETQIIKQADVVLAMFLLGDEFDARTKRINYDYYSKRTMHKSTLSASIYSMMGLSLGDDSEAYRCFLRTANTDIKDTQGSTWEGIHIASTGGTWQAAVLGFAGLRVDAEGRLNFEPRLPRSWKQMTLRVFFRGSLLEIRICHRDTQVRLLESDTEEAMVTINGQPVRVVKP
jgi:kojibiose phosphorylase